MIYYPDVNMATVNFSVTPISGPAIAWNRFLKDTQNITGQSCTRGIDKSKLKLSPYAKFIVALTEFHSGAELNPIDILPKDTFALRHLYFSFLITGPTEFIYQVASLLDAIIVGKGEERSALVTGSLAEWKQAFKILGDDYGLLNFFNQMGLKNVMWARERQSYG